MIVYCDNAECPEQGVDKTVEEQFVDLKLGVICGYCATVLVEPVTADE